jgi:hypothetical protein
MTRRGLFTRIRDALEAPLGSGDRDRAHRGPLFPGLPAGTRAQVRAETEPDPSHQAQRGDSTAQDQRGDQRDDDRGDGEHGSVVVVASGG